MASSVHIGVHDARDQTQPSPPRVPGNLCVNTQAGRGRLEIGVREMDNFEIRDAISNQLYQHPAPHRRDTFGLVCLSPVGVYYLRVGGTVVSCPQDWAARIHAGFNPRPTRRSGAMPQPDAAAKPQETSSKPCAYRLYGMMPPCVLPVDHTGDHQDGWGGYYGNPGVAL